MQIPAGGATTIPSFGTGTLGYRSPISGAVGFDAPDALFGDTGVLVLELDASRRDPATNRAPVTARLIPVIEDLSLEATDGTLLRRSIPALFSGLGRRPLGGDRWGTASAGSGIPDPAGGDPYTLFPPEQCLVAGCSTRIVPEYNFTSSDPDIADFVNQDPAVDQPAQALSGLQRQGRHRQHLRAPLPVQRRHDDGDGQRRRLLLLGAGDGAGRQRPAPLRHAAAEPQPVQTRRHSRCRAAPTASTTGSSWQPAAQLHASPSSAGCLPSTACAAGDRLAAAGPRRVHPDCGGRRGPRTGGCAAPTPADRAANPSGWRPRPYVPGRETARGGGRHRGVAGLLAPPARRRRTYCAALPAGARPACGDRRGLGPGRPGGAAAGACRTGPHGRRADPPTPGVMTRATGSAPA